MTNKYLRVGVGIPGLEEEMFVQQRCCQEPGWARELRKITGRIVESRDIGLPDVEVANRLVQDRIEGSKFARRVLEACSLHK